MIYIFVLFISFLFFTHYFFCCSRLSPNVWLQLTSTLASASANVPEVERLNSRVTRAEERASATQQLYVVLDAGMGIFDNGYY
jgi:hypothetical protein